MLQQTETAGGRGCRTAGRVESCVHRNLGCIMRRHIIIGSLVLAVAGCMPDDPVKESEADRVARLVRQLGHSEFAKREQASKELDAIGEPALGALRKAAAADPDAEIRRRAERVIDAVQNRVRAAATEKALRELQGTWLLVSYETDGNRIKGEDKSHLFTFNGNAWTIRVGGQPFQAGTVTRIEGNEKHKAIDLLITEGGNVRATAASIYAVEGNKLKYLNCGEPRATEFVTKPGDGRHYLTFRRATPEDLRPPEVRLESAVFSTDLILPESQEAVHRVRLTCRLADGEAGTLTFDPTAPTFDEFGDPALAGKPAPAVTVDVTLKLVKSEKGRQLFDLRGPKLTSRLSVVEYPHPMAWGDARLLVRGKDGRARHAINLRLPHQQLPPPCHPGCFPAGTLVHVPGGTKAIETVREGDLVVAVDAYGKPSPAKVTGVFVTRNRVLELRPAGRALVTTATQPVGLVSGGFRGAGELLTGDRIWRWVDGKRRP
jgi:uncharacterized protein (TIGR03067 family)